MSGGRPAGETGKGTTARCPTCGKKFHRGYNGQICCGKSCAARWRNKQKRMERQGKAEPRPEKQCEICGKSLAGRARTTRFCSEECGQIARRREYKQKIAKAPTRDCELCGQAFHPKYETQRFCCRMCARHYGLAHKKPEKNQLQSRDVLLMVVKEIPVSPPMRPRVGKIYEARECKGQGGTVYIIPEIGRLGLIVRVDEAKVIEEV